MMKPVSSWRNILIKGAVFWVTVVLVDFGFVFFFGPQIWSYAAYLFGSDIKTTLVILLFIEGGFLFAFGAVWASGSMETVFQGSNLKTNPYYREDDWKQRREQTRGQNVTGQILMLAGGPLLMASFVLLFI